jgi:hypothetical protein
MKASITVDGVECRVTHRDSGYRQSKESPLAFWCALAHLTSESVVLYPLPVGGLGLRVALVTRLPPSTSSLPTFYWWEQEGY